MTLDLGEALEAHRHEHGCDALHCDQYLDIARRHTAAMQRTANPVMHHLFLSVRPPADDAWAHPLPD